MIQIAPCAVDVIVLHRPGTTPCPEILQAIRDQRRVNVTLHLQVGAPQPGDRSRWETIARARNAARQRGSAPWVMFVDDDVLLDPDCISTLLSEFRGADQLGAVAADFAGDLLRPERAGHIGMGATLFRRSVLQRLNFRFTDKLCECWCACLDLKHNGVEIRYSPTARVIHPYKPAESRAPSDSPGAATAPLREEALGQASTPEPRILAAFDRRDIDRFEHQFLKTLRAHGNRQQVTAVAYGLYPTECRRIESLDRVTLDWQSYNGQMVPVRRVADFARHLAGVDPRTPIAYWDVADVVFQDSLDDLWRAVRATPDRLLAVAEPKGYPHNQVIPAWSLSIHDPRYAQQAFELLKHNPFLNSGFAAGTAASLRQYFQAATQMRSGPELTGTTDWGDQMGLNMYCHQHPQRWQPIDPRWNFCVHDRAPGEVRVTPQGKIMSRSGARISVAHGNARSLRQFAILRKT